MTKKQQILDEFKVINRYLSENDFEDYSEWLQKALDSYAAEVLREVMPEELKEEGDIDAPTIDHDFIKGKQVGHNICLDQIKSNAKEMGIVCKH